jgi:drug/metabolite transporter (DMT)-like permease
MIIAKVTFRYNAQMRTIQDPSAIDYIFLILLSAIWGSAFVAIEVALRGFDPFFIAFLRIFFASFFIYAFVFYKKLSFPKDLKTWSILILTGFLNNAMPFFMISWGQQFISANTAAVMLATGPFVALVFSHFFTHDENFTFFKLLGVILGFLGVFILFGADFSKSNEEGFYGKIALLIAILGYISSGFLIRKVSHVNTFILSSSVFFSAWIMMIPYLFFISFEKFDLWSNSFLAILYLGLIPTAAASLFRIELVQRVGVQFMSQVSYLIPIFTIIWSWIFFNETPNSILYIALVFIFAGLFIRKIKIR